jgi:hypothetical protein
MNSSLQAKNFEMSWPPEVGERILFNSDDGMKSGYVRQLRWGLVWRDFVLDDGRVVPEHKVVGCPSPPTWRNAQEVSQEEREAAEDRLVSMSQSGLDPRDREQAFWAELNQYLAYTFLRFKDSGKPQEK